MDGAEAVRGDAAFAQPLGGVVDAAEKHVADEGEDGGIRVEGAEAAEGEVFGVNEAEKFSVVTVEEVVVELEGDEDADEHADDGPDDGGDEELADDFVVIGDGHFLWMVVLGQRGGGNPVRGNFCRGGRTRRRSRRGKSRPNTARRGW